MTAEPWSDWIPGALSKEQMVALCKADLIRSVENPEKSVDASNSPFGWTNPWEFLSSFSGNLAKRAESFSF